MINKAGKKICIVCYQYTKEYMDDYQARSAQHLADMLPPNYSLPTHLQVKFQQLKDKVFTNTDQAGPIVDEIEQWIFSHQGEIKEVWESYVRKDEKKRSFPDVKSVPQRLPLNSPVKNTVQGNEQIQTNNSSNLVFYLLGGLVGLGLISLISYLIIKAKKGKKE